MIQLQCWKIEFTIIYSDINDLSGIQVSDPARVQTLMQTLDFHYQALASGIAQHGEQRRAEIEKEKQEKAAGTSWLESTSEA